MPMGGIHASFKRFSTSYARCDTSDHLLTIFYRENSRNGKICPATKQLGMVTLIAYT